MKKKEIKLLLFIFIAFICCNVQAKNLTNVYEITPEVICSITRDKNNEVLAMQGVYFFDSNKKHYVVYAGYESDTDPIVITLVDLDNECEIITKNNDIVMGHANDITYNGDEDKFYVTSSLVSKQVYGFKIVNNEIIHDSGPIVANFRIGSFDYDNENHKYYSQASDAKFHSFTSFNSSDDYKLIASFPLTYDDFENGESTLVRQGFSYSNNNIYFARTISANGSEYYNHSYITVFNATTGEYKYSMHFPSSIINGHLEGVTVIGDKIYFGMNINGSNPQSQVFLVYDGVNEIEAQYRSIVKETELSVEDDISLLVNEDFDYSRLKLTITYIDDRTETLNLSENNCQIIGFDKTKIGKQTITIRYNNKDYELNVNVKENISSSDQEASTEKENKEYADVEVPNTRMAMYIVIYIGIAMIVMGVYFILEKKCFFNKK